MEGGEIEGRKEDGERFVFYRVISCNSIFVFYFIRKIWS